MITQKGKGFTLTELMVTVAIIAIIGSVAYPSYRTSVERSYRGDAKSALLQFSQALERHHSTQTPMSYEGAATGGNDTGSPTIFPTEAPLDSTTKTYDLRITAATSTSYTITAQPKNAQTSDSCGTLTFGSDGTRLPAECW